MKKKLSRTISLLLTLMMTVEIFTSLPMTASARIIGSLGGLSWTLEDDGKLTISGEVYFEWSGLASSVSNLKEYVTEIVFTGRPKMLGSATEALQNYPNLKKIDLSAVDTTYANSLYEFGYDCPKLESVKMSEMKLGDSIKEVNHMFDSCPKLESVDFSNVDFNNAELFDYMFRNCTSLKTVDFTGVSTPHAKTMECMFQACTSLKEVDFDTFDNSNVTKYDLCFFQCSNLKSIYVADNWVTPTVAEDMFLSLTGITGEKGSKPNPQEIGAAAFSSTYAHIDGGDADPGYFTGKYTATWKNDDDTPIMSETVKGGKVPAYTGDTPEKEADEDYYYEFSNWDPEPEEVHGNVTYKAVYTKNKIKKPFPGHSISLSGNIGINFFVDPGARVFGVSAEDIAQGKASLSVSFSWDGEDAPTSDLSVYDVVINKDNYTQYLDSKLGIIRTSCSVSAAEMSSKVKATVTASAEGKDDATATDSYSVCDYAMTVINDSSNYPAKLVGLVKEMLNYGAMAQQRFGVNTDNPANKAVEGYQMQEVTSAMISAATAKANPGKTKSNLFKNTDKFGLSYVGSTVVFLDKNTLRHYYTVKNQAAFDEAKDSLTGMNLNESKSPYVIFEKTDIPASELDEYQEFSIGGQTYCYSVLDFVDGVLTSKTSSQADKELATATYLYNAAANEYFDCEHGNQRTEDENIILATCTDEGSYDLVHYCTECGREVSREPKTLTVDPDNHDIELVEEVPATYFEEGIAEHYKCNYCGTLYTDAQGSSVTTEQALVIPKLEVLDLATLTKDVELRNNTAATGTLAGNYKITIPDNANVTLDNVNISFTENVSHAGITPLGNANITLVGENTVKGADQYPAVSGTPHMNLIIKGSGSLTAVGGEAAAGIGGGNGADKSCGNIIIQDTTVNATGKIAAGIGGGCNGSNCGNIKITNSNVTAKAEGSGTAIGGGFNSNYDSTSTCGNITIFNSEVTAEATGSYGAGIGGGYGNAVCGDISITNSTVNAKSGTSGGAAIGAGYRNSDCGSITISECNNITAEARGAGAGIGAGYGSKCQNITLTNSNIIAKSTGYNAAGIGCGYEKTSCGDITIQNCNVTAVGKQCAAGIGSGYGKYNGPSVCGNIRLTNSEVNATGGSNAAAIGSGYYYASCGDITIDTCTVIAKSSSRGTGIGSGRENSTCGNIKITGNSTVTATGDETSAGIGSSYGSGNGTSTCGNITIDGGTVTATGGERAPGIGSAVYEGSICGDITIKSTVTSVTANKGTNCNHAIGTGERSVCGKIVVEDYTKVTTNDNIVDLSTLNADYEAKDGDVLTGTIKGSYKITIAANAKVILRNVTMTRTDGQARYAGITTLGDATLILEGNNKIKSTSARYPAIFPAEDATLTIEGSGELYAYGGYEGAAAIGTGTEDNGCGDIVINGGLIYAYGDGQAAGIGSGYYGAPCGGITINGGIVTARGSRGAAGIGAGNNSYCGVITINGGDIQATGGEYAGGIGGGTTISQCDGVVIRGGMVYAQGGGMSSAICSGHNGYIRIYNTVTEVRVKKGNGTSVSIGPTDGSTDQEVYIEAGANVIVE